MSSQRAKAQAMEEAFLGGLEDAQAAYEAIVEHEAWLELGYETFADWWSHRVQPTMRALSMRPTREIAAAVVEKVREEEADLPPAQRRTQRELADMVGVSQGSPAIRPRSVPERNLSQPDLEPEPVAMPTRQPDADGVLAQLDERTVNRIKQHNDIVDSYRSLREDLEAIPAETMAAIKESVKPAVDSWNLVEACRELVRALSGVDIDLAAKAIDPDKQSAVIAAIAVLRRVEQALGVPA